MLAPDDRRVDGVAVLFDIDGTLVDTNYLHAVAWRRAFVAAGYDVPTARIHRRIGMGGSQLMEALIGEPRDDVQAGWRREFEPLKPDIRALPGAAALLRAVAARGRVVLASSSEPDDVEALIDALDVDDAITAVTTAGDVEAAKPEPDVFEVALERAGVEASRAIAVGDSVWDVEAAARAGLVCVGVLTGGSGQAELEDAGAVAVYPDPQTILERRAVRLLAGTRGCRARRAPPCGRRRA